jgi:hypothetical protein
MTVNTDQLLREENGATPFASALANCTCLGLGVYAGASARDSLAYVVAIFQARTRFVDKARARRLPRFFPLVRFPERSA